MNTFKHIFSKIWVIWVYVYELWTKVFLDCQISQSILGNAISNMCHDFHGRKTLLLYLLNELGSHKDKMFQSIWRRHTKSHSILSVSTTEWVVCFIKQKLQYILIFDIELNNYHKVCVFPYALNYVCNSYSVYQSSALQL